MGKKPKIDRTRLYSYVRELVSNEDVLNYRKLQEQANDKYPRINANYQKLSVILKHLGYERTDKNTFRRVR